MRSINSNPELKALAERIIAYAGDELGMVLPELRFFILDPLEFASLLEKQVFPTSPINIWEGKRINQKKHSSANGSESTLYYEVVQTGRPSYAYLNETNSLLTQASVIAHVLGHCEFSELNVLGDADFDRTEYVMHLVKKVNLARRQMGEQRYIAYWNACESMIPLIAPNSQHNLDHSVRQEHSSGNSARRGPNGQDRGDALLEPISESLNYMLSPAQGDTFKAQEQKREQREDLNLHGYHLRAPCQDVAGFLHRYAPATAAERSILEYFYISHQHQDFVRRTQIMNEGWAMYWEKQIMLKLFADRAITGVIDYSRVFSSVCAPRPWYARNPYHLGYHLWQHIECLFRTGRHSIEYREEILQEAKARWNRPDPSDPISRMRQVVKTNTDFEFLRRFLTPELVQATHLNRIRKTDAAKRGIIEQDVIEADEHWLWMDPAVVLEQMLGLFTHFYQPRIYVVDNDFQDGGLLLIHRDDGFELREHWIEPTLYNLHHIWRGPVYLVSQGVSYSFSAAGFVQKAGHDLTFDLARERMEQQRAPLVIQGAAA